LMAFFGCGSPKEDGTDEGEITAGTENFDEIPLTVPGSTDSDKAATGENNSKMFKFTGDDFTKIKDANKGSQLVIEFKATVKYACGEIGWKSISEAGPVISGNGSGKTQKVVYDVEDLFLGDSDLTIHMFNNGILGAVILRAAPDDFVPTPNPKATAGATKIVLPKGHDITGRGDLSKVDFKKITTASGGSLVFYFDDTAAADSGILKFGPKQGDPYTHYGISKTGEAVEGNDGWRPLDSAETRTITYTVAEIKSAVTASGAGFNKLEINNDASGKEGKLLYIELKP